jgi:hypothetical protein
MKTQLTSIEPGIENLQFQIVILVGTDKYRFTMTVETFRVGDRQIEGVRGDEDFLNFFKFNQNLGLEIYKLVLNTYNGQIVPLPIDIGNFDLEELRLHSAAIVSQG